jgi:PHD/YefM family antitoxin component YafN of YafNO toxin-antitoxin module
MRFDEEELMPGMVADLSVEELQAVIRSTVEEVIEDRLEDLQALSSTAYLRSVAEAREDYKAGRVVSLDEIMNG